jgi:enoyl-[acyl-carrier protein] reductase III
MTALVTGASRGLGQAIARSLCGHGCHVHLNYVTSDVAAKEAAASMSDLPGGVTLARGDVRDGAVLQRLLRQVHDQHGRLDIFVHNAASFHPMLAVAPSVDDFFAEQRLSLHPLLYGASTLARLMNGRGRVIAISSNGAFEVIPNYVATGVAKAALESLVRYLAVELAPFGITVNSVATHLLDKGAETANKDIAGLLSSRTPNGRLTRPEDVADVVSLLCRPEAAWLQGQVITVDGGLGLRA